MNRAQFFALALTASLICLMPFSAALAFDVFWDHGGGGIPLWNVDTNWAGNFVPNASFGERAVIGTDDPAGLLEDQVISSGMPPQAGGIALGLRERDSSGAFINPAPAPGTLFGTLLIPNGILENRTTVAAASGADGRVLVGVDGRGYLVMVGGTLTATGLSVGGELISTGEGVSRVELHGTATVNVNSPGDVTFGRNLKIVGPNVTFSAAGDIVFEDLSSYFATITSPTSHSPLRSATNVLIDGDLFVDFTGAGTSHAIGQTWDLVDAISISGSFDNLSPQGNVVVTGGSTLPGAAYKLQVAAGPADHQLLQLVFTQVPEPSSAVVLLMLVAFSAPRSYARQNLGSD